MVRARKKAEKIDDDDAAKKGTPEEVVLDYLKKQYRPYSTNDIIQNLHGEFSKAVVHKTLEGLGGKGLIVTKMFGKVLVVSAAKIEIDENEKMTDYPELLRKAAEELETEESRLAGLQEELKVVKKYPDDGTLDMMIRSLESDLRSLEDRMEKASKKKSISSESIDCLKKLTIAVTKETDKRLKIYKEFMKYLSEFIDIKSLIDELGLEEPSSEKTPPNSTKIGYLS